MNELHYAGAEAAAERKWKAVFTIVEPQGRNTNPERKFWLRVGTAFVNRDGSLNVRLDAIPTNGTLHIRDQSDEPRARRSSDEGAATAPYAQKGLV